MRRDPTCRLVVFDIAGTTVRDDGQVAAALKSTLEDRNLALDDQQFAQVRGMSKREALRQLLANSSSAAGLADEVYERFKARLTREFARRPPRAIAGAEDGFRRLRDSGVRVALTTGFDRDVTNALLSALGWSGLVDAAACGDEVARGRPAPDLIYRAMALVGVRDAGQVANVGDTTADLHAAAAASVRWNIGVLSGAHSQAQLASAPHTHLVASAADVPALLLA